VSAVDYYVCVDCGHVWTCDKKHADAAVMDATLPNATFRLIQSWGPHKGRQGTIRSEHATVAEAFAALDRFATEMVQAGVPSDAIELVVTDEQGDVIPRPGTH
jgi:hypothetical protein